ncbi:MAG: sigma-70 family RNA polymerase sigma factor [Eubacteriales bacterium]
MRRGSLIHIPRSMEGRDLPRLFSLDELSEDGGLDELSLDLSPSPEERVIAKEEREQLERAVRSLPLNEYAVIAGVYFGGHTLERVSRSLGLSRSRAWQLKKSALARLRGMLGDA